MTPLQRNEIPALEEAYEAAHEAYFAARKIDDQNAVNAALFDIDRFGERLREQYRNRSQEYDRIAGR